MNNPFFRATSISNDKVDVNVSNILFVTDNGDSGSTITFIGGTVLSVTESARTVRGATRKAWPKAGQSDDAAPAQD